jgi:hypothetical protein
MTPFSDFLTDLDAPLLKLAHSSYFTLRMAFEGGIHALGAPGAGKTSAFKTIASALLRTGAGMVICVTKPDEIERWIAYAQENGREKHLVFFTEDKSFNPLAWELTRHGVKGVGSAVECLMRILDSADHAMGVAGQTSDPFWPSAVRSLLNYAVPLLYCAWGTVNVNDIVDFVTSAATKPEQYTEPGFIERSFAGQTLRKAVDNPAVRIEESELHGFLQYWFREFPAIPEKTRGNIVISMSTKLDRFRHGRMRSVFCGRTTIVPEMTFHGAIIILCMPTLTWNEDGIIGQRIFKYMWQRAVESRNALDARQRLRPVFLWADESQNFVDVKDDEFLATCRSSRAGVVFLTQTLPSYYARLGEKNRDAANGLVGKFATQLFFLNSCPVTNEHAAKIIGRDLTWRATQGRSTGTNTSRGLNEGTSAQEGTSSNHGASYGQGGSWNHSHGDNQGSGENYGATVGTGTNESENWSEAQQMDNILEPRFFASALKSGGPANHNLVSAVWFRAGARFEASGSNWLLVTFRQ